MSIRAGIVGAGLMGHWHAEAVKRAGGRLLAVIDSELEKAEKIAARHPEAKAFTDLFRSADMDDLLRSLDVLHICTPLDTHFSIASQAVRAGMHVIVEKPVARTPDETIALLRLASEENVLVCPVYQFLFQDGVRKARRILPQVGRIVSLESRIASAGGEGKHPTIGHNRPIAANRPIVANRQQLDAIAADILPHPLSLMQAFAGSNQTTPSPILDVEWHVFRSQPGELHVMGELPGMTLLIAISMNARPTENAFRITGTHGTIHLDLFHGFAFRNPGGVSRARKALLPFETASRRLAAAFVNLSKRTLRWEPAYPGLQRLVYLFYDAIASKTESPIPVKDIIAIARARALLI